MPMFKTILLPVDLADVTSHLPVYAKVVAQKFEAEVHIVYVAPFFQHYAAMYVPHPSIRQIEREIADGAQKRLAEVRKGQFADMEKVVVAVLQGDPAEEIIRYAHREKVGLIIMGTHTRKGISKVVWGSVSERVIKGVRVPVMVISPNIEGAPGRGELMDPYI